MADVQVRMPSLCNFFKAFSVSLITLSIVTSNDQQIKNSKASKESKSHDDQSNAYDVKEIIVIGGGIAGMAAARELTNHREFHVKVLEACEDRYGGRIWTNRKNGVGIRGIEGELGAMWVNSKRKNNRLLKLIKDLELNIKAPGPVQLHVPHLRKVYMGDEVNGIFSEMSSVIKVAVTKAKLLNEDISLTEAIQEELELLETTTDKSIILALIKSHYAMTVQDYSAQLFEPEKDFGWDTVLVDGFDQVIDGIVSGLEGEIPVEVELETVVRQIEVNKTRNKVIVRTTDLKQHFADAIVIALPLGVLKNDSVLFDPYLPKEWYSTIRKTGISYTNRLILEFDKAFWPKDVGVFTMVPNDPSEFGFFQTWFNIHYFTEKPILMGNIYGEKAKLFEQLTDDEVKLQAISILSKMFGKETVWKRKVVSLTRSKWQADPHTLGGNSYPTYGVGKENLHYLSDPVCPYIYFAGEYTDKENAHTLLGAYNSGLHAAKQLIEGQCQKPTRNKRTNKSNVESDTEDENLNNRNSQNPETESNTLKDEL